MEISMDNTTIFVMTHKKANIPADKCYVPLHVGRANGVELGYQGDDEGDNISKLNCYYGELTGLYWIWKNYKGQENIGICHYRRYFIDEKTRRTLLCEQYDNILSEYEIMTSNVLELDDLTNLEAYAQAHMVEDMILAGDIIEKLYPKDKWAFDEIMGENGCSFGNLMVTSRKRFDEYCGWLFPIFDIMIKEIDFNKYPDDYHRRVFGFLAETLLNVWVRARRLNLYRCQVGMTGEKAETKELKLALGQLIKMGQLKEARKLYYDVIKIRPDVKLANADLSGEMFVIEQLLYIMELEQEENKQGMLGVSDELSKLIEHFNKITYELYKLVQQESFDKKYFIENNVTDTSVEVISRNNPQLQGKVEWIMKQIY